MGKLAEDIGQRIRTYRLQKHLTQEKPAELADCYPTYIGQLERAEKNVSIESIGRITAALDISLSTFFENIGQPGKNTDMNAIPLKFYNLILQKNRKEQINLYNLFIEIDHYKHQKP